MPSSGVAVGCSTGWSWAPARCSGAGVILTGQSRLVDLTEERELRGTPDSPLVVPPGAVVVPGTRPAGGVWATERGISLAVPVIVKRRDGATAARVVLEEALR